MEPWRLTDDPLSDFTERAATHLGITKRVFSSGEGPGVIVMTEVPGISPEVARFARRVRDAGLSVHLPNLFGDPGRVPRGLYPVGVVARVCVSREFAALRDGVTAPITDWLRAFARDTHARCGGPGVGAIGMCFTGNFGLSMMLEPSVLAPVLCQPSLPLTRPSGIHTSPEDLVSIRERMRKDDLLALAYRFEGDRLCSRARFDHYESVLGDRIRLRTLPASAANPAAHVRRPHSVVTQHLIDREGEPTREALEEIVAFFVERLSR
jgi:dienelactone hydrolase